MTFTPGIWKKQVAERASRFGDWLKKRDGREAPHLVYGGLCGMTIWPLVEAAQSGLLMPAALALGSIAGGVGANLIANRLEKWKERADEAEVHEWAAENAQNNPDLRDALDAIMEHLDVIARAEAGLDEEDRAWFSETLAEELRQLGNFPRYEARLTGSGAIAQGDGARVVGKGGALVEGDVQGDVVGKNKIVNQRVKNQYNIAGNVYNGPAPEDDEEALRIYREVLARNCANVSPRSIDREAGDAGSVQHPLGLANVYIDLNTTTSISKTGEADGYLEWRPAGAVDRETLPLSALVAAANNDRMTLLGDPGSGKTTFIRHLVHCLADPGKRNNLAQWPEDASGKLPILVILRDFAHSLPDPVPEIATPNHLWSFITDRMKKENLELAVEPVRRALEKGGAIVLLDGLDEISTLPGRVFVRDAVNGFADRYPGNRFLVTCRVLSYQPPDPPDEPDLRLAGFLDFELAPFDEVMIDRFIQAWYEELGRKGNAPLQEVEGLVKKLQNAVRQKDIKRLATNPLLLTVMALVHAHKGKGELPDARAKLYEESVDILLWRWEQIKSGDGEDAAPLRRLLRKARRTDADLMRVLWELAFDAHPRGGEGKGSDALADIDEHRLEKALAALNNGDRNWAMKLVETMKLRAGLLLERAPEVFTFPQRTFQEYLAGAHLARMKDLHKKGAALAEEPGTWREVILLAAGRMIHVDADTTGPLALAAELCPE
ncbi:MAG: NACHT domain-containing protein, partial [Desulfobacterales bacterium]|nr:NACHT domain-containing protein [Desulfobacterales bacterium]